MCYVVFIFGLWYWWIYFFRIFFDIEDLVKFLECVIVDVLILLIMDYYCIILSERDFLVLLVRLGGFGIINLS